MIYTFVKFVFACIESREIEHSALHTLIRPIQDVLADTLVRSFLNMTSHVVTHLEAHAPLRTALTSIPERFELHFCKLFHQHVWLALFCQKL